MAESLCTRASAQTSSEAAPARAITGITIPRGARAVLVFDDGSGRLKSQPVARDASVLNVERDLLKHLNEFPLSDEWLMVLRAYCDQRLAARAKARAAGSVITPSRLFDWDMAPLAALQARVSA